MYQKCMSHSTINKLPLGINGLTLGINGLTFRDQWDHFGHKKQGHDTFRVKMLLHFM